MFNQVSINMRELVSSRTVWLYAVADARRDQAKAYCPPLLSQSLQDLRKEAISSVEVCVRFKNGFNSRLISKELHTDIQQVAMLPGQDKYMLINRRSGLLELKLLSGDLVASHDIPILEGHFLDMGYAQKSGMVCYAWKVVSHSEYVRPIKVISFCIGTSANNYGCIRYPYEGSPAEVHLYRVEDSLEYKGCYTAPYLIHSVSLKDDTLAFAWLDTQSRCFLKIVSLTDDAADQHSHERIVELEFETAVSFIHCTLKLTQLMFKTGFPSRCDQVLYDFDEFGSPPPC
jgi:hypothetical protein